MEQPKYTSRYTFGDNQRAARRLQLLASLYAPPSEAFLREQGVEQRAAYGPIQPVCIDLGCGPGRTTYLLHETLAAPRTFGIDVSERYVQQARKDHPNEAIEFLVHDLTASVPSLPAADCVFGRFLLTHVNCPGQCMRNWLRLLAPGGRLLLQEVATLSSEHPVLRRYYELVGELQRAHGQDLHIGAKLGRLAEAEGLDVRHFQVRPVRPSAAAMAELHALNMPTWRQTEFAIEHFDGAELDELEAGLWRIVQGEPAALEAALGELVLGPTKQ